MRKMKVFNQTLLGRLLLGPLLSTIKLLTQEKQLLRSEPAATLKVWAWTHTLGLLPVTWVLLESGMPVWMFLLVVYPEALFSL